ncbi:MAG: hypothetical protein H6648_08600 [Caldilineae bacterium]|nr:hypothetical protein [Chloroflexota bacterium]MCB9177205.1 hypothetical protein [Caldilineae bacterium]
MATDTTRLKERFASAGLERYELDLALELAEQAAARKIPLEDIPALARNLDRIDWDAILVRVDGAAEIIGVDVRQVGNLIKSDFEWIAPTIWLRNDQGNTVTRLWLGAKVKAFARMRLRRQDPRVLGWLKRKRRDSARVR